MSDLLLKIDDQGTSPKHYKDGDIICAFSRRDIECKHAEHICFERDPVTRMLVALDKNGLIPSTDVLFDWCNTFYEYKFERVSRLQAIITRLSDNQQINIRSNRGFTGFDGRTQHMDIEVYLARRLKSLRAKNAQGFPIFGSNGREIWFGGKQSYSDSAKVTSIWNTIATKKGQTVTDPAFDHYPLGYHDVRSHLPISIQDINDTTANNLVQPVVDNTDPSNPIILKKRRYRIDWLSKIADLGASATQIRNKRVPVDARKTMVKRLYTKLVVDKKLQVI